MLDDAGNLVTDGSPKVMLQLASGNGKLGGTLEAIADNGVAQFPEVTYDGVDPFTVKAVSSGLPSHTVADQIPVVTPQGEPASLESARALSKALGAQAGPPGSLGRGQSAGSEPYPGWSEAVTDPEGSATNVVVQPLKELARPGKPFAVDVELCNPAGSIVQEAPTPVTLWAVTKDGRCAGGPAFTSSACGEACKGREGVRGGGLNKGCDCAEVVLLGVRSIPRAPPWRPKPTLPLK